MSVFKRLVGMAPTAEKDGTGFIPSPLGRALGVDKKSGYQPDDFGGRAYTGEAKILVLCTEKRYLEMTNGVLFSTGHNVQETAVPLMHLTAAGFDFDIVTPTGAPAVLEHWSVPREDTAVLSSIEHNQTKFDHPVSLISLVEQGGLTGKLSVRRALPSGRTRRNGGFARKQECRDIDSLDQ
jgi:molecular chaperone Hsp31 and glyoxalase 3